MYKAPPVETPYINMCKHIHIYIFIQRYNLFFNVYKIQPVRVNAFILAPKTFHPQVEQPGSSLLRHAPWYVHLLFNCGPSFFKRTWMGLFGHFSPKATQLFGSAWGA